MLKYENPDLFQYKINAIDFNSVIQYFYRTLKSFIKILNISFIYYGLVKKTLIDSFNS